MNCCVTDDSSKAGLKVKNDPVPLCYCFGFDESHIRDELARSGRTTIPEKIRQLIGEGLCACDSRNPSGRCCLGEVIRAVERLKQQLLVVPAHMHVEDEAERVTFESPPAFCQ